MAINVRSWDDWMIDNMGKIIIFTLLFFTVLFIGLIISSKDDDRKCIKWHLENRTTYDVTLKMPMVRAVKVCDVYMEKEDAENVIGLADDE